jgi:hypothetical protein
MKTLVLIAIAIIAIATTGLIWTATQSQSVDAWHSLFASKKECVNFMKNSLGNTTAQAQVMCNKVVPH